MQEEQLNGLSLFYTQRYCLPCRRCSRKTASKTNAVALILSVVQWVTVTVALLISVTIDVICHLAISQLFCLNSLLC